MGENITRRRPNDVVSYVDQVTDRMDGGMGDLRRADIRQIAFHMVRRFEELAGHPANLDEAAMLATKAVAASYVAEIGAV